MDQTIGTHEESFMNGMVLAKDHTRLAEGELGLSTQCYYKVTTDGLFPAPSRIPVGVINSTDHNVYGLRAINIPGIGDKLLAGSGNGTALSGTLSTLGMSATGAASVLVSGQVGTATSLDVVPGYDNLVARSNAFVMNGVDKNIVLYNKKVAGTPTLMSRAMGMQPVSSSLTGWVGGGTWSKSGEWGYYWYWITEVFIEKDSDGVVVTNIESSFTGTPVELHITADTDVAFVRLPSQLANDGTNVTNLATHFRIYRSATQPEQGTNPFPAGELIQQVAVGLPYYTDQTNITAAIANKYPTQYTDVSRVSGHSTGGPENLYSTNVNTYAQFGQDTAYDAYETVYDFGMIAGDIAIPPVQGVQVKIGVVDTVSNAHTPQISVRISKDSGTSWSNEIIQTAIKGQDATFGGISNTFGLNIDTNELPNFRVKVYVKPFNGHVNLYNLRISIYSNGTSDDISGSSVYAGVQVSYGDLTLNKSEDDPPPIATTGDIFEGALVTNDVSVPVNVRWSAQGKLESFSTLYYLPFALRAGDSVNYIKNLGRCLLVGAKHGFWRMNYLPTQFDVTLDRGRVADKFDVSYGPNSLDAATDFTGPDGRPLVAYATQVDIRATDGFATWPIVPDFPFPDEVDLTGPVILKNNPENWELILYFKPKTGGQIKTILGWNQAEIRFNYHPSHLKENPWGAQFRLKCSPVIACANQIGGTEALVSSVVFFDSGLGSIWMGYSGSATSGGGSIYVDTPLSVTYPYPTTTTIAAPFINSRMLYLSGRGGEWKCGELYLHCLDLINTPTAISYTAEPTWTKTNYGYTTEATKTVTAPNTATQAVLLRFPFHIGTVEGMKFKLTTTPANKLFGILGLIIRGEDFGVEESAK